MPSVRTSPSSASSGWIFSMTMEKRMLALTHIASGAAATDARVITCVTTTRRSH
jgi:hypothetical protein